MPLPIFDKEKKKKAQRLRNIVLGLSIAAVLIFGGIYFVLHKELGSIKEIFQPSTNSNQEGPISLAPVGRNSPSIKYENWDPIFFHDKLCYCDSNYKVHVKTEIKADDVYLADRFSDGLARIQLRPEEKPASCVYIGSNGKIAIEDDADHEYRGPFSEGLAAFLDKHSHKLGFMDKHGKTAIPAEFFVSLDEKKAANRKKEQLENSVFSSGLAPVYSSSINDTVEFTPSCGYIDHKGNYVIPIKYIQGCAFVDDRARVDVKDKSQMHHRWGYIDPKGKLILKPLYMKILDLSEGLAAVLDYKGKWGYIDKDGKYVIPSQFTDAESFTEGFATCAQVIENKKLWGYIRKDGSWLVPPRFDKAEPFHNGEAYACNGSSDEQTKGRKRRPPREEFWIDNKGKIERHHAAIVPFDVPDLNVSRTTQTQPEGSKKAEQEKAPAAAK